VAGDEGDELEGSFIHGAIGLGFFFAHQVAKEPVRAFGGEAIVGVGGNDV